MLLVSPLGVEPGSVQSIKAMGPQKWWHRLDESSATPGVGGYFGKSRTEISPVEGSVPIRWVP